MSLFDTLFLIPLNLPAVPRKGCASTAWLIGGGSGCKHLDQSPGGGFPLASVSLELFLRENCLEQDTKSSNGSRFPMASWQSVVRGDVPSDGGVERYVRVWRRADGGRSSLGSERAVNYTDQTLIPKAHLGCVGPLEGERCVGGVGPSPWGDAPWVFAPAQWNWHTPSLLLHHAWLTGPFPFKLFSLSFPLFVSECPT